MKDPTWPFDADRDDPLTVLRIPVTPAHPDQAYLVALTSGRDKFLELFGETALRPDDGEAAMIASYVRYLCSGYSAMWQRKLAERPFDLDGARATIVLRKRAEDDWCYRLSTWHSPRWSTRHPVTGLAGLLDHIATHGGVIQRPSWAEWKAAHPDVFAVASVAPAEDVQALLRRDAAAFAGEVAGLDTEGFTQRTLAAIAADPPPGSFAADMLPPDVREQLAASAAAVRCPNDPPCEHGGLVHEFDHDVPRCVADDCPCGAADPGPAAAPAPVRQFDWQKLDGWTDCAPPHPATHRCVSCATDDELADMLARSLRSDEPS